jgi:hypothetical protein
LLKLLLTVVALLALSAVGAATGHTAQAGTITKHDRDVIRFFKHHPKLAATPAGGRALAKTLPHVIRSLQVADAEAAYPPHHNLWVCINRFESYNNWSEHHGSRGGGLQMSDGWLGYISGRASDLSQAQQEWVAERAYAASGYSYLFLYGQWYKWDDADGCGTTG